MLLVEEMDGSFWVVLIIGCLIGIGLLIVVIFVVDVDKCFKVYVIMWNLEKKFVLEEVVGRYFEEILFIKVLDVCSEVLVNSLVIEIESVEGWIDVFGEL